MELSSVLMFKILAIVLCDDFFARMVILLFLILEISEGAKKKRIVKKSFKDILVGISIICFNSILILDFYSINFLFLGIGSFFLRKMEMEKYMNIYFLLIVFEGVIELCLRLQ